MDDIPIEVARDDGLVISTDRTRIDIDAVLTMLRRSHWAWNIARATLERAIANSVTFGVYDTHHGARQIGFARAISDLATYAYLSDVIIAESERGRGIGGWLVQTILAHPDLQHLRRIALFSRDAPDLYRKFGFGPMPSTTTYLEIRAK